MDGPPPTSSLRGGRNLTGGTIFRCRPHGVSHPGGSVIGSFEVAGYGGHATLDVAKDGATRERGEPGMLEATSVGRDVRQRRATFPGVGKSAATNGQL